MSASVPVSRSAATTFVDEAQTRASTPVTTTGTTTAASTASTATTTTATAGICMYTDCVSKKFTVITALHGMQTRSSDENNSVCLFVRFSVCLSVCQTRGL